MTYELAKQLKDAGFPQNEDEADYGKSGFAEGYAYCPTLSELILEVYKYCHEVRLDCTKDNPGVWAACTCWGNGREDDWVTGSSPEEAVASLWFALNKK